MTSAVSILPQQQLAILNEAYRAAVRRKRLRGLLATALFLAALIAAAIGSEVNLRTFFTHFGNLISYVGTLSGAVLAFVLNFFAAENTSPAPWLRFTVRRALEFARTVPGIVFALIFVIAFGLGPMAGVLAIA